MSIIKGFLIGVAIVLVIHIVKLVIIGFIQGVTHIKTIKLFHYFDNILLATDNFNKNDLYIALAFSKTIDNKQQLGYNLEYLDTMIIGNYKVLDDEGTTTLDKLFFMPMKKYERLTDKLGNDFTSEDLVNDGSFYLQYNTDKNDVDIYVGKYLSTYNMSLANTISIKKIITRFYNIVSMKKENLGILLIIPQMMQQINESIERMVQQLKEAMGDNKRDE